MSGNRLCSVGGAPQVVAFPCKAMHCEARA